MEYWIFRSEKSGLCLAVADDALGDVALSDELGELLHDKPMSREVADMYIARHGGRWINQAEAES